MKYILADREKCNDYNVNLMGTRSVSNKVLVNEVMLNFAPDVPGTTLEEKAEAVDGEVMSEEEALSMLNNKTE